jgi:hypothetical protein
MFLGASRGPDDFPAYCNPLLGDFNVMTLPGVPFKYPMGTPGWQIFEQLPDSYDTSNAMLHVQAIGIIAWALWTRSQWGTYEREGNRLMDDVNVLPCAKTRPFPNKARNHPDTYSRRLHKLI